MATCTDAEKELLKLVTQRLDQADPEFGWPAALKKRGGELVANNHAQVDRLLAGACAGSTPKAAPSKPSKRSKR